VKFARGQRWEETTAVRTASGLLIWRARGELLASSKKTYSFVIKSRSQFWERAHTESEVRELLENLLTENWRPDRQPEE
jgi:hypothetical protein